MNVEERDRPFGDLPSVGRIRYAKAQLQAVVAEIRFVTSRTELTAADAAVGLERFAAFGIDQLEAVEQQEMAVTVAQGIFNPPAFATVARGWQYRSEDHARVITLMPGVASIQVATYGRWSEDFAPAVQAVAAAAKELCDAAVLQRAGLRYINRLDTADGWVSVVRPTVAGVMIDPVLGPKVTGAHQQFELALEARIGALVRHGPLQGPDGLAGYLLDLDVYDTRLRKFVVDDIVGTMQRLNRTSVALFSHLLSESQVEHMVPVQLDPETTRQ